MRLFRDDRAVGQAVAFTVAAAILIGTISVVLLTTSELGTDPSGTTQGALDREAQSLADVLLDSSGIGWENGADGVTRLGFLGENGSLDQDHIDALRGALYEATPGNGLVDYEEALTSLGLEGRDFHIRIVPAFLVEQLQGLNLSGLRVAYVGDWDAPPGNITVMLGTEAEMRDAAETQISLGMATDSELERIALDELGLAFDNMVYVLPSDVNILVDLSPLPAQSLFTLLATAYLSGDVYMDIKEHLRNTLVDRLDEYDILIIGSGVDQSSLTSEDIKTAIRDWVLAGGDLMVMGSDSQNFQWLQPLFSVGTTTVTGGAFAPDLGHPMLNVPNQLDWGDYDNFGLAWDLKDQGSGANVEDFTHIVLAGDEDILAVSNQGVFGDGRVFLTTWRALDIAQKQGLPEAMALVENMVLYADRSHLYLDYGPSIPDDVLVAAAARYSYLVDPEIGQVPVRFEVLVW